MARFTRQSSWNTAGPTETGGGALQKKLQGKLTSGEGRRELSKNRLEFEAANALAQTLVRFARHATASTKLKRAFLSLYRVRVCLSDLL